MTILSKCLTVMAYGAAVVAGWLLASVLGVWGDLAAIAAVSVILLTIWERRRNKAEIMRKSFGEGVLHLKDIVEGDDR